MNKTFLLLKCAIFSKRALINLRAFLQLNNTEFYYVISAILYSLDKSNKGKVFGPEQIAKIFFIFSRRKIKDYRQLKNKLSKLQEMGYFNIMFVKKEAYGYVTYYTINPDKMNYFLSAFNTFINYELENIKTADSLDNKVIKKIAKKDVLKHIQTLKRLSKNR